MCLHGCAERSVCVAFGSLCAMCGRVDYHTSPKLSPADSVTLFSPYPLRVNGSAMLPLR